MANDKITYNEQLDWFQRTKAGRTYIAQCIGSYILPENRNAHRDLTDEQYITKRNAQIIKLYHSYVDTLVCGKTDLLYRETNFEYVKKLLGEQMPIVTAEDISIVHELARSYREQGDISASIATVVTELRAVKALIENNYENENNGEKKKVEILVSRLCNETNAPKNALQMAKLNLNARFGMPMDVRIVVGTPLQENFDQIPIGRPFQVEDFLPDRELTTTKAKGLVGMLSGLLKDKEKLRRPSNWNTTSW